MRYLFVLGLGLVCAAGCSPVGMATSGFKAVKGASAHVIQLKDIPASTLAAYKTLKLGQVTTDVPRICTTAVISSVQKGIQEAFADKDTKKVFPGGGKTLTVNVACRFCKSKSMFGKEARLDLLVSLADGESNEEVGSVYVEGINESMRETSADAMAKKDAEKLVSYLKREEKDKE